MKKLCSFGNPKYAQWRFGWDCSNNYKNMPVQIYWKFYHQKMNFFFIKNSDVFHISSQNIDRRGGSNEYPKSMFWAEMRKKVYPSKPQFYYIKMGFKVVKIIQACFRDVRRLIWIFAGRTCPNVRFLTLWLKCRNVNYDIFVIKFVGGRIPTNMVCTYTYFFFFQRNFKTVIF